MTALDLTALAADCEARAAAGEKPVHPGWKHVPEGRDDYGSPTESHWFLDSHIPVDVRASFDDYVRVSFGGSWHDLTYDFPDDASEGDVAATIDRTLLAGRLFAEALLREATAPLHAAQIDALAYGMEANRDMMNFERERAETQTILNVELESRIAALEAALAEATPASRDGGDK